MISNSEVSFSRSADVFNYNLFNSTCSIQFAFPSFGSGRNNKMTKWSSPLFLMKKNEAIVGDSILLNPCRPGARNGNNFKCSNPVVQTAARLKLISSFPPSEYQMI